MNININDEINKLLQYGLEKNLITQDDYYYCANRIIDLLNINSFEKIEINSKIDFYLTLNHIVDYAYQNKVIDSNTVTKRDIFDSKLMDCLMIRPSELNLSFWSKYKENKQNATDYFYELSKNINYIRTNRISKNISWKTKTEYGEFDITINLSKPEKDPSEISKIKNVASNYPKCLLCRENEGFRGKPGRSNHRIIKLTLNQEPWFMQYSPYVYYNEHCIVLSEKHEPMKINRLTFKRLLDFVSLFPHYFIGSNADIPIVGGSILNHNHFQGGRYDFAMAKAQAKYQLKFKDYPDVQGSIIKWPMSVIRISSKNRDSLIDLADKILNKWLVYSNLQQDIMHETKGNQHNTITPIVRYKNEKYEIDLVLRNNRTTELHPLGLFHPHKEHHHLKKENIGLIEVMGLAVLPKRLKQEIEMIKDHIINHKNMSKDIKKHSEWIKQLKEKYTFNKNNIDHIFQKEVGYKFVQILKQCAVFKDTEEGNQAFLNFINCI